MTETLFHYLTSVAGTFESQSPGYCSFYQRRVWCFKRKLKVQCVSCWVSLPGHHMPTLWFGKLAHHQPRVPCLTTHKCMWRPGNKSQESLILQIGYLMSAWLEWDGTGCIVKDCFLCLKMRFDCVGVHVLLQHSYTVFPSHTAYSSFTVLKWELFLAPI